MKTLGISKASIGAMGQLVAAIQQDTSERATSEPAGPAKVVAAVATGSVAGNELPQPKPLMCRLAALMEEWRTTRDNMKARGEDDAAIAVECCMETLHEDVSAYLKEMREYRTRCAPPQNDNGEPRSPKTSTHGADK